ncbi:MAG: T9SS type A sorting domain-containing protein, partial [Chitinophagaceae bacterium]|nr:T9SS type A sorting domain-containing protein [Chitinophagaceae bacterium]
STTTITACNSYLWNDSLYTTSTTHALLFPAGNVNGCDSTATLVLTIIGPSSSITTITACNSYLWNDSLYMVSTTDSRLFPGGSVNGCDSTATLILTISNSTASTTTITACNSYLWNDSLYTASTTNSILLPAGNANGCDSTATLVLTINSTVSSTTSITACNSYLWNDSLYTNSTTHSVLFSGGSTNGCDSTATLILTINNSVASTTTIATCNSYLWNDSLYTSSTTHSLLLPGGSVNGCDSTATLVLTINSPVTSTTTITACDSYLWNDSLYTTSTTHSRLFPAGSVNGCDSTSTLILTINSSVTTTTTITACNSYLWNDSLYTVSTTHNRLFPAGSVNGCDSTATLVLTINSAVTSTSTVTTCNSYIWNDSLYTTSTTHSRLFAGGSINGCDSTATLVLTINGPTTSSIAISACNGYLWNDSLYSASTTHSILFPAGNVNGCDSTATLILTINTSPAAPVITTVGSTTFCQGGSVTLTSSQADGNTWSTGATTQSIAVSVSGTYFVTYTGMNGCTSVNSLPVEVTVNPLPLLAGSHAASVFGGDSLIYLATSTLPNTTLAWSRAAVPGISPLDSSGTNDIRERLINNTVDAIVVKYIYTLSANGCDNTDSLLVTVEPPMNRNITPGRPQIVPPVQDFLQNQRILEVAAYPNPSTGHFNLSIRSNHDNPVAVKVLNVFGQVMERHEKLASTVTLRFGYGWNAGTYFVEVLQDKVRKVIKIVKVN